MKINYNKNLVSEKKQEEIENFISELLKKYELEDKKIMIEFKKMNAFGFAIFYYNLREKIGKITMNQDLLKDEYFEELKGTLAHEFAHMYHYFNFSKIDSIKFLINGFFYHSIRILTKNKFIPKKEFMENYEKYTDLTAIAFGYKNEILKLKKLIPIYRKNLAIHKVPLSSNYYTYDDIIKIDNKEKLEKELKEKYGKLNLKSIPYKDLNSYFSRNS